MHIQSVELGAVSRFTQEAVTPRIEKAFRAVIAYAQDEKGVLLSEKVQALQSKDLTKATLSEWLDALRAAYQVLSACYRPAIYKEMAPLLSQLSRVVYDLYRFFSDRGQWEVARLVSEAIYKMQGPCRVETRRLGVDLITAIASYRLSRGEYALALQAAESIGGDSRLQDVYMTIACATLKERKLAIAVRATRHFPGSFKRYCELNMSIARAALKKKGQNLGVATTALRRFYVTSPREARLHLKLLSASLKEGKVQDVIRGVSFMVQKHFFCRRSVRSLLSKVGAYYLRKGKREQMQTVSSALEAYPKEAAKVQRSMDELCAWVDCAEQWSTLF